MKIKKFLLIFGSIFFAIGLLFSVIGGYTLHKTNEFLGSARKGQGVVKSLDRKTTTNSDGGQSTLYYPVVEFKDEAGQHIVFTSSSGSQPPSFSVGEQVEVYYDPKKPSKAKINSFFSLWGALSIFMIFGLVFGSIGALILFFTIRAIYRRNWVKRKGRQVQATVTFIGYDTSYTVNHRHPSIVKCQWKDGLTNKTHTFKSEGTFDDIISKIKIGDTINVMVNMRNPSNHWVDIERLPSNTISAA